MTSVTASVGEAVTIGRDVDAPRALVWWALLDPEQLVRYWPPPGATVPLASVTIEPWLGGRFENTMVDEDGAKYRMSCTFLDAVEPERFTFCEPASGIVSTTFLTELGPDRTRVVVRQVNVSELYRSPEALEGFQASFDRLAAHLAASWRRGSGRLGRPAGSLRGGEARSGAKAGAYDPTRALPDGVVEEGSVALDHGPVDEQVAHARWAGRRSAARRRPGSRPPGAADQGRPCRDRTPRGRPRRQGAPRRGRRTRTGRPAPGSACGSRLRG